MAPTTTVSLDPRTRVTSVSHENAKWLKRSKLLVVAAIDTVKRRFVVYRKERAYPLFQRPENTTWPSDKQRYRRLVFEGFFREKCDKTAPTLLCYAYYAYSELFDATVVEPTIRWAPLDQIDAKLNWVIADKPHAMYLIGGNVFLRTISSRQSEEICKRMNELRGFKDMFNYIEHYLRAKVYVGGDVALYLLGLIPKCPSFIEFYAPLEESDATQKIIEPIMEKSVVTEIPDYMEYWQTIDYMDDDDDPNDPMNKKMNVGIFTFLKARQDENGTMVYQMITLGQSYNAKIFYRNNGQGDALKPPTYRAIPSRRSCLRYLLYFYMNPANKCQTLPRLESAYNSVFIDISRENKLRVYSHNCICRRTLLTKRNVIPSELFGNRVDRACYCSGLAVKYYLKWLHCTYRYGSESFKTMNLDFQDRAAGRPVPTRRSRRIRIRNGEVERRVRTKPVEEPIRRSKRIRKNVRRAKNEKRAKKVCQ